MSSHSSAREDDDALLKATVSTTVTQFKVDTSLIVPPVWQAIASGQKKRRSRKTIITERPTSRCTKRSTARGPCQTILLPRRKLKGQLRIK
jgi:hypothetical protein